VSNDAATQINQLFTPKHKRQFAYISNHKVHHRTSYKISAADRLPKDTCIVVGHFTQTTASVCMYVISPYVLVLAALLLFP